jgi:cellulose synthase/poly-beta-1,6-N-acetylglucosamine synthase-like glycosyltransferase
VRIVWLIAECLGLVVFCNRYIAGLILHALRRPEVTVDLQPSVTVVTPLFNEGARIRDTLAAILASDYPDLRVICVDDCSTDDSYERACELSDRRLTVLRNASNVGKRRSIIEAVRMTTSDIIVSIDSDVIVDPDAIAQLVRRFSDPRIAAIGGWVDIRNKHDNWLTRMQTVKYWYAYFAMRNIEWAFRRILCLSGCLTAYRRSVLVELEPVLESRNILGVPIKYGEDRFLTRQIIKAGYLTSITLDARCTTAVPTTLRGYFAQQLRWRRSNIVDYSCGITHIWRLNPLLAVHYCAMFGVLILYPLAVMRAALSGRLFAALTLHIAILVPFGLYYRWRTRRWPAERRVGALAFLPQAMLMVVTYALLTPLALFTLDSTSWETRGPARVQGISSACKPPCSRTA